MVEIIRRNPLKAEEVDINIRMAVNGLNSFSFISPKLSDSPEEETAKQEIRLRITKSINSILPKTKTMIVRRPFLVKLNYMISSFWTPNKKSAVMDANEIVPKFLSCYIVNVYSDGTVLFYDKKTLISISFKNEYDFLEFLINNENAKTWKDVSAS